MTPFIGITTYERNAKGKVELPAVYADAVRLAGGIPVLIQPGDPRLGELFARLDGLIISGGDDVDPVRYGGQNHPKVFNINQERDEFEIALTHRIVETQFPTLCICRGAQVLNVALGGTLIEHIPDEPYDTLNHQSVSGTPIHYHPVTISPESRLAGIIDATDLHLETWHHQSIRAVAPPLTAVAFAPDGIVEGVEMPDHRWLFGVQWHPERAAATDPAQLRLFQSLVAEAAKH